MLQATGNLLTGHPVSPYKFQGITTLAQIEAYGLIRPTLVDRATKGLSPQQQAAHRLHEVTNRHFDKPRKDNATEYAGYIQSVEVYGRPGGTPAITLYHQAPLEETENGVVIPYGAGLVAIDGETQTEARFLLRERLADTAETTFAITLYHGISVQQAMQILHDYNTKGLPWSETKAARFNHEGQLSKAAADVIRMSGISTEKINYSGRSGTKKHIVSNQQILTAIAGYQLNGAGSEVSVSANHFKKFNAADAISVPPTCTQHLSDILIQASTTPLMGKSAPMVWQMVGVLLSKNYQPSQLNWEKANEAYNKTKVPGRGGPRTSVKKRLADIEAAMIET